ncbi:unnamed protein product [Chrysoparadoxa australica]
MVTCHSGLGEFRKGINNDYTIGAKLGEGGYGTVHTALSHKTGQLVAIKKIDKSLMNSSDFAKEVNALQAIHSAGGHPCIAGVEAMYEDNQNYYLVEELVEGGEMFEYLCNNGAYSEKKAASLMQDLALGLQFLHAHGVVHADLKPENLMLSSEDIEAARVKVVDFGCSANAGSACDLEASGTTAYWPPECVQQASSKGKTFFLTKEMDMWAAGVILFIMLTGAHPFDLDGQTSEVQLMENVVGQQVPLDSTYAEQLSPSAKDLIGKLCDRDPTRRLTAQEMINHPWITGETASSRIIEGSDERLAHFRDVLREKVEAGVFSMLVTASQAPVGDAVDVVTKAFNSFDKEGKGFVSAGDIARVLQDGGEKAMTEEESKELAEAVASEDTSEAAANGQRKKSGGLSVDSIKDLMSSIGSIHYQPGDYIFRQGDPGDYLYFLNSGKVDILVTNESEGKEVVHKVTSLGSGQMFGEAAVLNSGPRSASVRCTTPVQAVRIGRDSVIRMMGDAQAAGADLREVTILREINRAKAVLRTVGNVHKRHVNAGDIVVQEGDLGDSMYTIADGTLDVRVQQPGHMSRVVARLGPGDVFGEMALVLSQPRTATVECVSSQGCCLSEMKGETFKQLLGQSSDLNRVIGRLSRMRQFRQDMLKHVQEQGTRQPTKHSHFTTDELKNAFDKMDRNHDGQMEIAELTLALRELNSTLSDADIEEIMGMADLGNDGFITFDEFCRIMRWEEETKEH